MIDVRVEVTITPKRVLVSGPIRNLAALDALLEHFEQAGKQKAVRVHDDPDHALIADACLEHARRHKRLALLVWGDDQYRVEMARLPRAAGKLLVVGGFPLLDSESECAGVGEPGPKSKVQSPKSRDHGGGRTRAEAQRRKENARELPPCAPATVRETWLDWVLRWLLGTSRGEAVRR